MVLGSYSIEIFTMLFQLSLKKIQAAELSQHIVVKTCSLVVILQTISFEKCIASHCICLKEETLDYPSAQLRANTNTCTYTYNRWGPGGVFQAEGSQGSHRQRQ